MADNRQPTQPRLVVIEEEPPHEFYAALLGVTPPRTKRCQAPLGEEVAPLISGDPPSYPPRDEAWVESRPLHELNNASRSTAVSVVPPTDEEDSGSSTNGRDAKGASEFTRAYRRACSDPPRLSSLSLTSNNKGYEMLSRMGWKEEGGGLGRRRQGGLQPVKTRMKNNRKGLGVGKPTEARITHRPHERKDRASAEDNSKQPESKAERRRRAKKEHEREERREKRARMLLRTDVPPEYEELYWKLHQR